MKKLFCLVLALMTLTTSAFGAAGLPQPSVIRDKANQGGNENMRAIRLGYQLVDKKVQVMRAVYDFSSQGGAVSTINLKDEDGKDAVLPNKAIIKQVIVHAITAVTSGGAATVALGANTTTDLLGATAKTSFSLDALVAGVPVGTAASAVRLTAQRTLTATIATAALNAGKLEVFVEYYIGN